MCPCLRKNRTGCLHPITCTSGHLPDNFIWWHFRTVVWLGYVKVALLVKHVNVVLPQSSCWCSSIINWGLMNRGNFFLYVASVVITYSLNCLRCESPYRAHNSLWRLHLQLICSLSLFLSCLFLFRQPCKLSSISLMYFGFWLNFQKIWFWNAFESSFKLVNRLNLSKNWFRTVCTVYQKSSINSVPHVADTIENVLWSSFYCPRINLQQIYWILKRNSS